MVLASLTGAPEPVPGQHKPWYEMYLSEEAQAAAGNKRWQMALDSLSPEEKLLVETKRAIPEPTGDPYKPVKLHIVSEELAADVRAGRVILVPQVGPKATAAASPTR